ncbi:MAG: hypothetical protein DRJ42_29510 [Deltaproteobacteria bacterium]|nr:MAG: hypothetical protein DRJ42_29510 [Deltaproteobacteria bacterium]
MKRTLIATLLTALTLTGAACTSGVDGPVDTGLDRGKKLSAVTDAEAQAACMSVTTETLAPEVSWERQCTGAAVFGTATPDACAAARTGCLEMDPPPPEPTEPTDCSTASASDLAGCDATVGQFEDCMNASYTAYIDYINALSCADAGMEFDEPNPPECQTLEALCPGFFGDDEV